MSAHRLYDSDKLEPVDAADGFLSGIGSGRVDRLDESPEAEKPDWLRARWSELRGGRYPRVGRVLVAVSRCLPASFYDWAVDRLDDGSIWSAESAGNCGPSDTGTIGLAARREADWEIGFRLMCAATPIWLLIGIMFAMFVVLQSSRIAAHHQDAKIGPVPAAATSPSLDDTTIGFIVRGY